MDVTVVKVGGSLAQNPEKLRALCSKLGALSRNFGLVVVPGGGEFADVTREMDKRFSLSPWSSHRMAILGMDMYGFLLADLSPNSCIVYSFEKAEVELASKKLVVLAPSQLMFSEDPLPNSWDVTSDSISAFIANKMRASKLLLLTDVDGIFTGDPKNDAKPKLLDKISAKELSALNRRTSIDSFLSKVLLESKTKCYVVNGNFPDRVEAILKGQDAVCTLITS